MPRNTTVPRRLSGCVHFSLQLSKTHLKELTSYLDSPPSSVPIDLRDPKWHVRGAIPSESGWYYISTNTPLEILQRQRLPNPTYVTAREGKVAKVKNYDLGARASRHVPQFAQYFNVKGVYSGLASDLLARAREHTFSDPGTGGLALSRYPDLFDWQWSFHYVTLRRFAVDNRCDEILLRLGEQLWRSKHGWPILCAE